MKVRLKKIISIFIFLLLISGCAHYYIQTSVPTEVLTDKMATSTTTKSFNPLANRAIILNIALDEIATIENNTGLKFGSDIGVTVAPTSYEASAFTSRFTTPINDNVVVWDYYWSEGLLRASVAHEIGHIVLNLGDDRDIMMNRFAYCFGSQLSKDYLFNVEQLDTNFDCKQILAID